MDACDMATSLGAEEVEGANEMNRKQFLKSLGLFMILPGAGRVWRARRYMRFYAVEELGLLPQFYSKMIPIFYRRGGWIDSLPGISDFMKTDEDKARILEDDKLTETVFIINQGLVTRPRENPHLISQVQPDRQGEQQHTVLGRAIDPLHPPNDRSVS